MSSTLTNLTAATTWSGTDLFYAVVSGNSRKIAASSFWTCDAANVLSDVNSTTAQTVRIYRTFTDSSNYERLALQSGSGYVELAAETSGTGTDNLDIRLHPAGTGTVLSRNDTNSGVVNHFTVWNNFGGSAQTRIQFYNDGGSTSGTDGVAFFLCGSTAGGGFSHAFGTWLYENGPLVFATNNTERVRITENGDVSIQKDVATPAGGSATMRLVFGSTAGFGIYVGSGAPSVSAAQGSLYLRSDGSSSSTRLYVNSTGSTTWVNVTTAS